MSVISLQPNTTNTNYPKIKHSPTSFSRFKKICSSLMQKMTHLFYLIIKSLSYPLRFVGSKTWSIPGIILRTPVILFHRIFFGTKMTKQAFFGSGYHYHQHIKANEEQVRELLRYVAFTTMPFRIEDNWLSPFKAHVIPPDNLSIDLKTLPGNLKPYNNSYFIDISTPQKILVLEDDNEIIVAFGAKHTFWHECKDSHFVNEVAGSKKTKYDDHNSLSNKAYSKLLTRQNNTLKACAIGLVPRMYRQAHAFGEKMKEIAEKKNKRLVFVGQSLGGAIAQYAALKTQTACYVTNSIPLGVGLQQDIGTAKLNNADNLITHLSMDNDFVSNFPGAKFVDPFFNIFLAIKTPANPGNRLFIPSVFKGFKKLEDAHGKPLKSVLNFLYKDPDKKPETIPLETIAISRH